MGIPRGTPGKSLNRYGQFTLASCIWQTLAHDELGNTGMITTSPVIECALDAGIPHERQGGIPHDPTSSSVAPGNRICWKALQNAIGLSAGMGLSGGSVSQTDFV